MFDSPRQQSVARVTLSIAGAMIGIISTLFIYPLDMELHGLAVFLVNSALILSPFLMFGSTGIAINFFPEFSTSDKKDHGFLPIILSIFLLGTIVFSIVFIAGNDIFVKYFASSRVDYNQYYIYILPLTIFHSCAFLLDIYLNNLTKVFIPAFLKEFLFKITFPLLILLQVWDVISIKTMVMGLVANYAIVSALLFAYIWYLRRESFNIDFSFLTRPRSRRIANYGMFAILGVLGAQMVNYLDIMMIKAILPPTEVLSIYFMNFTMANFVNLPTIAISAVAGPMVARHLKSQNLQRVGELYTMSTNTMLTVGVFLFTVILICLPNIYPLMKNGDLYATGSLVFVFLGASKIIDMATGLNTHIITLSKYYRFNLYGMILLGALNAVLNYWLIHKMGITGAALATMLAVSLYNFVKLLFVWYHFRIHPFESSNLYVFMVATVVGLAVYLLPLFTDAHIPAILAKGLIFTGIFWFIAIHYNFSPQITDYIQSLVAKYIRRKP